MIRLQGNDFYKIKPYLKIVGYEISSNGNIKAIMKRKDNKGSYYSHWLHDIEKDKFINSNYYKNTPARKLSEQISFDILKKLNYNY